MELRFMYKTRDSNIGNCPAMYEVTSSEGGYVVQGKRLGWRDRRKLRDLGRTETAVWVPADIIERSGKAE
jgi:hypothetical protein